MQVIIKEMVTLYPENVLFSLPSDLCLLMLSGEAGLGC
jgi:hypothetical protein